jgi:hypothetical protein
MRLGRCNHAPPQTRTLAFRFDANVVDDIGIFFRPRDQITGNGAIDLYDHEPVRGNFSVIIGTIGASSRPMRGSRAAIVSAS